MTVLPLSHALEYRTPSRASQSAALWRARSQGSARLRSSAPQQPRLAGTVAGRGTLRRHFRVAAPASCCTDFWLAAWKKSMRSSAAAKPARQNPTSAAATVSSLALLPDRGRCAIGMPPGASDCPYPSSEIPRELWEDQTSCRFLIFLLSRDRASGVRTRSGGSRRCAPWSLAGPGRSERRRDREDRPWVEVYGLPFVEAARNCGDEVRAPSCSSADHAQPRTSCGAMSMS